MISLRDVVNHDKDKLREWRNLPDVRRYMYSDQLIPQVEHDAWFARMMQDSTSAERCKYWIIVCDGEDVGVVNLVGIDRTHSRCYWAFYLVSPNIRGKGVGSFVEFATLRYVFEELKLEKLCCEVLAFNGAVVEMHKSFGFVQEGTLRQHIRKDDGTHDVVCLSILRPEWEAKKPELEEKLRAKGLL